MRLDPKYYNYCDTLGIMKENTTHQNALNALIKAVNNEPVADPDFKAAVSKLTLDSPEVSVRSCMLYRYKMRVKYVVNGQIKTGVIDDFGNAGTWDSLHITEYQGDGEYKTINDLSSVPYSLYNEENLFTLEQMKGALKDVINHRIPSNTTSYESEDWSVSLFIVPVLCVLMDFRGKTYQLSYNLHNNYYAWKYPDDIRLINKGKKARTVSIFAKIGGFALTVITALILFLSSSNIMSILLPIILLVTQIILLVKTKKPKSYYLKYFVKHPKRKLIQCIIPSILIVVLPVVLLIVGLIIN